MKATPMGQYWIENKHRSKVSYNAYRERVVKRGMTFEEAITSPKERFNNTSDEYKKWSDIAVENGINKNIFWHRHFTFKWSLKKAATTPIRKRKVVDSGRQTVIRMIEAGAPIPKKYIERYPDLFNARTGA
ncbi:hypothetical protein [Macrococcoides caseolyticum]|uniref:Uncharacterized protein n=1 Tax=Macrococcoides caseolyticum TaxID=69966 RepID=A0A855GMB0_9STAP|nr:hypothetical protein [Macrococcus caseolyticus]PKE27134.1 hypothetical protein CW686_01430 [Macrococcus caseolyticus]PKE59643.1 hypothetical protein CW673_01510 [Macrococcus caseolyticus]PKE71124.1 hypothetical protein CW662_01095 [Macrococcus caseolyticus]